jgi:energy-coupling factor transport system permease protein
VSTSGRLSGAARGYWLDRSLHPGAWWLWAIGLATAASRTTNPVLLAMLVGVACTVVFSRRGDAPWAQAFRLYLWLAVAIVVVRVVFRLVFGGGEGDTVLLVLPGVSLPSWTGGLTLFGSVSAESLLSGFYDGLRLATMVVCIGAANALANPKRMLKAMPGALYETGTVVVVAMSVFPQLAESVLRVRAARRLRGDADSGMHALRAVVVPVLEDALERSLRLAAAMDSRGYGRAGDVSVAGRRLTGLLTVGGLIGVCVGVYATLDGSSPRYLAGPLLGAGVALAVAGFALSSRRVRCTRYRPDRWRTAEAVAAGSGLTTGVLMWMSTRIHPLELNPSLSVLSWPTVPLLPAVGVLIGALPALLTPSPPVDGAETPDRSVSGPAIVPTPQVVR